VTEQVDIADIAHACHIAEHCGPSERPRWIAPARRPLDARSRNPLLDWKTMAGVVVRRYRLRDVVLDAGTMMLLKDGAIVRQTEYHRSADELASLRVDPARLVRLGGGPPVLMAGDAWSTNHYHWLNHGLPAIAAGLDAAGPDGLRLAMHQPTAVQERSLHLLGLDAAPRLVLDGTLQYAIHEVEFCTYSTGIADFAVSVFIQKLADRIGAVVPDDGPAPAAIYLTRAGDRHRRISNEADLVRGLIGLQNELGLAFDIVDCGRLTLDQQVARLRAARLVIAPHGAALANVAFCRPDAQIYELLPAHYTNTCMLPLGIRARLAWWSDSFASSGATEFWHDWTVDVAAVLQRTREIAAR